MFNSSQLSPWIERCQLHVSSTWETGVNSHRTRLRNYSMKTWKTLKLGKAVCFWQITRKSPLILQFFVVLFCMWAVNKYYTVAVCCSRSKKRPDLNYGCFPMKTDDHKKSEVLWKRAHKKLQQTNRSKNLLHFKSFTSSAFPLHSAWQ